MSTLSLRTNGFARRPPTALAIFFVIPAPDGFLFAFCIFIRAVSTKVHHHVTSRTLDGTRSMDKQDLKTEKVMRDPKDSGQAMTQLLRFCFCNPSLRPF
jgi:hypothetical protein